MARIRGTGLGTGMALGTAVIVQVQYGIPLMPEPPPRIAEQMLSRRLNETPEVILLAKDYRTALAISTKLPWAKVVGIAAETADPDVPTSNFPAVVNIPGLLDMVLDDVLILVDATLGTILVDPDPVYLSQYTAEHERLAPRQRIYLDEQHQSSNTEDGRAVQVIARVQDISSLDQAMDLGPDGVYVNLPIEFDPEIQRKNLLAIISRTPGKPIFLDYQSHLSLRAILQASISADITLIVPDDTNCDSEGNSTDITDGPISGLSFASPESVEQVMADLFLVQADCLQSDVICGLCRLGAAFHSLDSSAAADDSENVKNLVEELAEKGATRIFFEGSISDEKLSSFDALLSAAKTNMIPVICILDDASADGSLVNEEFEMLVGAGVAGFICASESVQALKHRVRSMNYGDCHSRLLGKLQRREAD